MDMPHGPEAHEIVIVRPVAAADAEFFRDEVPVAIGGRRNDGERCAAGPHYFERGEIDAQARKNGLRTLAVFIISDRAEVGAWLAETSEVHRDVDRIAADQAPVYRRQIMV